MREHFLASLLDFLTVCFFCFENFHWTRCLKFSKSFKILFWKLFPLWVINFLSSCARKTNYFLLLDPHELKPSSKIFSLHFLACLGILAPITSILAPNIAKRMVFNREFIAMLISRDCMLSYHWFHLSNYCDVIFWVFS